MQLASGAAAHYQRVPFQRESSRLTHPHLPARPGPQPGSAASPAAAAGAAAKRAEALRAKYAKLRSLVTSAEQGLQALLQRLMVALQVGLAQHAAGWGGRVHHVLPT
jgi:hypothetical protein